MSVQVPITIVHGDVITVERDLKKQQDPITTHEIKTHDGKTIQLSDEEIKIIATQYMINQALLKTPTPPTTPRKRTIPPEAKCIVCGRNNVSLDSVPRNYVNHHTHVEIPANAVKVWSCFSCSH